MLKVQIMSLALRRFALIFLGSTIFFSLFFLMVRGPHMTLFGTFGLAIGVGLLMAIGWVVLGFIFDGNRPSR
jgi:hypothetical protein